MTGGAALLIERFAVCARDCTAAVTSSIPIKAATTEKLRAERGAWTTSSLHIAGLGAVIFPHAV
jgi:hypothetical protein